MLVKFAIQVVRKSTYIHILLVGIEIDNGIE